MHNWRQLLAGVATIQFLLLVPRARAQSPAILAGPEPAWVVAAPVDARAAQGPAGPEAWRFLLRDQQINGQTHQLYVHDATRAVTVSGAKETAQIEITFDPTCQTLAFHWLRVVRNGVTRDELDTSRIVAGPAANPGDNFLCSDLQTARFTLGGLAPGDVVDYAYTITGLNPSWGGHWFGRVRTQEDVPAQRLRARLLWPSARLIYAKNYLTGLAPVVNRSDRTVEFLWDQRAVPGLNVEADLPLGYDPFPAVQLSEFHLWSQINQWALTLFTNTARPTGAFASQLDDWRRLHDPAAQTAAVLRFLQDEIKNTPESGADAYKMAPPGAAFERRFGDSKEKALLFCAALRALSIQCAPALVNTNARQDLVNWQPSPTAFNHALAVVTIAGVNYWLDPTAMYQRGPLGAMDHPAYGYALIVKPGATALTPVPPAADQPGTSVTEDFQLGRPDVPAIFKSVLVAKGADADALRALYATTPPADIEKQQLDLLAKSYPHIEQTAPSVFHDDEQLNQIEVDRFYRFAGDWTGPTNVGWWYSLRLHSHNVDAVFPRPTDNARAMPIGAVYPSHQTYRANVQLAAWLYTPTGDQTIRSPFFTLHWAVNFPDNGHIVMESEYNSLSPAIPAESYPEYQQQLQQASSLLDFTLGYYPE